MTSIIEFEALKAKRNGILIDTERHRVICDGRQIGLVDAVPNSHIAWVARSSPSQQEDAIKAIDEWERRRDGTILTKKRVEHDSSMIPPKIRKAKKE